MSGNGRQVSFQKTKCLPIAYINEPIWRINKKKNPPSGIFGINEKGNCSTRLHFVPNLGLNKKKVPPACSCAGFSNRNK
jgi:hypothetical protein